VLLRNQRVVERVVLVVEFDDRARQAGSLFQAQAFGDGAGGDVAHHDFQGDDFHFLDQLLAHVEAADKVGGHAKLVEARKYELRNPVVQNPLAVDHLVLLAVKGGGVILEVLYQRASFRAFIENFGLAFVNLASAVHEKRHPWRIKTQLKK